MTEDEVQRELQQQGLSPYVRYHQLKTEEGVPWSRPHLKALEDRGEFPKRKRFGPNTVGWDRVKVRLHMRSVQEA